MSSVSGNGFKGYSRKGGAGFQHWDLFKIKELKKETKTQSH